MRICSSCDGSRIAPPLDTGDGYTDEQLIALCGHRFVSRRPLEMLIKRYRREIYTACLRYLRHPHDAEDALQDVLVRIHRYLHRFEGRSSFRTWLHRIIQNQCHSLATKQARQDRLTELALWYHDELTESVDLDVATDNQALVEQALMNLSKRDRELLKLRFYQDKSLDEIAGALGVRVGAAKMRLYRALTRLRLAYDELNGEETNLKTA